MLSPDRRRREWSVLVLRTLGLNQEDSASFLKMSKPTVGGIEKWFKSLSHQEAQRLCEEEIIKKTAQELAKQNESKGGIKDSFLTWLEVIRAEDVLRHYEKTPSESLSIDSPDRLFSCELASRYRSQLSCVPPLDIILPPLGYGLHRLTLIAQTNWYVLRNEDEAVRTVSVGTGGHEEDEAAIYLDVSPSGSLSLACPAESEPEFVHIGENLGAEFRQNVVIRGQLGAEFLQQSREALRAVEEDAIKRTDAKFREWLLQAANNAPPLPLLPKPALPDKVLVDDFWRSAFRLVLAGQMPAEGDYRVRQFQWDPLFAELFLGDTPIASGLYGDAVTWGRTHREIIADWRVSPTMIRLRQTHNELLDVYALLLAVLDRLAA